MDRRSFLAGGFGMLASSQAPSILGADARRQVVLDTETTGLSVRQGHRIIEIACVELINSKISGRTFHRLVNPDRAIEAGATMVHGLDNASLQHEPRFSEIAVQLASFLGESELIIHNADFDISFLRSEFSRCDMAKSPIEGRAVADTVQMARRLYPGQRASLSALCERFMLQPSGASFIGLHGAMLDARLLADVYLYMTKAEVGTF